MDQTQISAAASKLPLRRRSGKRNSSPGDHRPPIPMHWSGHATSWRSSGVACELLRGPIDLLSIYLSECPLIQTQNSTCSLQSPIDRHDGSILRRHQRPVNRPWGLPPQYKYDNLKQLPIGTMQVQQSPVSAAPDMRKRPLGRGNSCCLASAVASFIRSSRLGFSIRRLTGTHNYTTARKRVAFCQRIKKNTTQPSLPPYEKNE